VNVRHNWKPLCAHWRQIFTYSTSYRKDSIKCDSAFNAHKRPLSNGVSIVQKLFVKLSNTSTTFSQQVENNIIEVFESMTAHFWAMDTPLFSGHLWALDAWTITFNIILTINSAISKNLPSSGTKWLSIMTYPHPPEIWHHV
jgi:hypothetical protein